MARYTLTVTVDAPRQASVEKALRAAFKKLEDAHLHWSVVKEKTPESRADRLAEAVSMINDAKGIVEELKNEMESWRDSIPENLQGGDKYSEVDEAATALDEIYNHLDEAENADVSFPGMF